MTEIRPAAIVTGGEVAGIVPRDFDQCQRIAKMCVKAGMFKSRDGEDEEALAQCSMAIMQGMELGVPPMQAIQNIAVINGRCTVWGDLIPALIWAHGHSLREWIEGEGDDRVAHCEITRADGFTDSRSFSVADAKKAGLWDERERVKRKGKNGWYDADNDSPWFKYPARMLQMRARGLAARDIVADVLRGIYIREEMPEEPREPRDVTPEPPKPPKPKAVEPPPPPPEEPEESDSKSQAEPEFDVAEFMEHVKEDLSVCQDIDSLRETWTQAEVTMEDHLSRNDREELLVEFQNHESRIQAAI